MNIPKKAPLIFWCTTGLILIAGPAFALDMDFYTYGGFNPIVQAFSKVALIFSDNGYKGLFFVVAVLGLLAGVIAWLAKAATGARVIPMVWAVPVLFGIVAYMAFFVPKGRIAVYDPVLNRSQIVADVPDGIVFTAGVLNKIERGIVDIITTGGAPGADYRQTAGGIGLKAIEALRRPSPINSPSWNSMIRYIKDCVTFELMRPGTTLSLGDMRDTTSDFLTDLAKAVNPAVYTVYYDAAHPEGTAMTCTDAWHNLNTIYANPANYSDSLKKTCAKTLFDSSSAVEMQVCKDLISNSANYLAGITATPEKLIQQRLIAEILYKFYYQDDYEVSMAMEAERNISTSGLGMATTFNEWIPIIKALMTTIAIGTIPLLVLFFPTPIVGRAAQVIFGFFVFLTLWGITDVIIHGAAMDYATYAFEDVRQSNLGVYAMAALPGLSNKMLGMFGIVRGSGILLAGLFTQLLIKYGGTALAHLSTNLTNIARSIGAKTGAQLTPAGNAAAMKQQMEAASLLEFLPEHEFTNLAAAGAFNMHKQVGAYNAAMQAKNRLINHGVLDPYTSDAEMAERIAAGGVQGVKIGTDTGSAAASLGPNGSGMINDTLAGGTATYKAQRGKKDKLTRATVNGVSPMQLARSSSHQLATAASHALGSSKNYDTAWQQIARDSHSNAQAASFGHSLANNVAKSWSRKIDEGTDFTNALSHDEQKMLVAAANAGAKFKKIIGIGGKAQLQGTIGDKNLFNIKLSEATAEAFSRDQREVHSEAFNKTISDSRSLDYAASLAERIGATDAYNFLREARAMENVSETQGIDLMTGFVRSTAINRYGEDSPQHINQTINWLNDLATNQGPNGQQQLSDMMFQFSSQRGFYGDVTGTMDNFRRQMNADRRATIGNAGVGSVAARHHTDGIAGSMEAMPQDNLSSRGPTGEDIIKEADRRSEENIKGSDKYRVKGIYPMGGSKPGHYQEAKGVPDYHEDENGNPMP